MPHVPPLPPLLVSIYLSFFLCVLSICLFSSLKFEERTTDSNIMIDDIWENTFYTYNILCIYKTKNINHNINKWMTHKIFMYTKHNRPNMNLKIINSLARCTQSFQTFFFIGLQQFFLYPFSRAGPEASDIHFASAHILKAQISKKKKEAKNRFWKLLALFKAAAHIILFLCWVLRWKLFQECISVLHDIEYPFGSNNCCYLGECIIHSAIFTGIMSKIYTIHAIHFILMYCPYDCVRYTITYACSSIFKSIDPRSLPPAG